MPLSQLGQIAFGGSRAGQGNSARDRMKEEQYKAQLAEYEADMERRRTIAGQQFRGSNIGEFMDQLNPQQLAIAKYAQANMMGEHVAPDSGTMITELLKQVGSQHSPQPTATMQDFDRFVSPEEQAALYRQKLLKPSTNITTNIGGAGEEPMKITEIKELIHPTTGLMPPVGTTRTQAGNEGYLVREKGATGEGKGKAAATTAAWEDLPAFNALMYNPDGSVNQNTVRSMYGMSLDYPGKGLISPLIASDDGQKAWNFLDQGIQSILRNETGAAFGDDEIGNILGRYMPSPTESEEVQKQKLQSYEQLLTAMTKALNPNGYYRKELGLSGEDLRKAIYGDIMSGRMAPPQPGPRKENTPAAGQPLSKEEWRAERAAGRL